MATATATRSPTRAQEAARPRLVVQPRELTGKAVARLRRAGILPAVVFGHGVPSRNVQLDTHEFEQLRRVVHATTLIDLVVDGEEPRPALVHGVQIHPVTRRPLHVDLFLVRMTEEITVDVPLVPVGVAPAVDVLGGTLLHLLERVRVKALPDRLPAEIEYPLERLTDFDAIVHVRDLAIPDGVTLLTDPDEVVAKVEPPRIVAEEVAPPPPAEIVEEEEAQAARATPEAKEAAE
ncbi:MAG TPA: 50S ribosomal protein L25 [Candidatus Limnocylindrales bacterium]|nr:50S ribosomal protein L25 [Candidatus Limnocylindrales bacterium]